jgi:hypothetical protein
MTENEWKELKVMISELWPDARFTDRQRDLWRKRLKPYEFGLARIVVENVAAKSRWKAPKLDEVLSEISSLKMLNEGVACVDHRQQTRSQELADERERIADQAEVIARLDALPQSQRADIQRRYNDRRGKYLPNSNSKSVTDWPSIMRSACVLMLDGELDDGLDPAREKAGQVTKSDIRGALLG